MNEWRTLSLFVHCAVSVAAANRCWRHCAHSQPRQRDEAGDYQTIFDFLDSFNLRASAHGQIPLRSTLASLFSTTTTQTATMAYLPFVPLPTLSISALGIHRSLHMLIVVSFGALGASLRLCCPAAFIFLFDGLVSRLGFAADVFVALGSSRTIRPSVQFIN